MSAHSVFTTRKPPKCNWDFFFYANSYLVLQSAVCDKQLPDIVSPPSFCKHQHTFSLQWALIWSCRVSPTKSPRLALVSCCVVMYDAKRCLCMTSRLSFVAHKVGKSHTACCVLTVIMFRQGNSLFHVVKEQTSSFLLISFVVQINSVFSSWQWLTCQFSLRLYSSLHVHLVFAFFFLPGLGKWITVNRVSLLNFHWMLSQSPSGCIFAPSQCLKGFKLD